jgi:hypothetical protein
MNNGKIPFYQLENNFSKKYKSIANEGLKTKLTDATGAISSLLYLESCVTCDFVNRCDYLSDIESFIENEIEPLKKEAKRRREYHNRVFDLSMYKVSLLPYDIKRHISEFIPKEINYTQKVTILNYYKTILDSAYFKSFPLEKLYKIVKDDDYIIVYKSYSKKKIIEYILEALNFIDVECSQKFLYGYSSMYRTYKLLLKIKTYKSTFLKA